MSDSKWISVTERLPDAFDGHTEVVLVSGFRGEVQLAQWESTDKIWLQPSGHRDRIYHVTHWQPLPDPPEES